MSWWERGSIPQLLMALIGSEDVQNSRTFLFLQVGVCFSSPVLLFFFGPLEPLSGASSTCIHMFLVDHVSVFRTLLETLCGDS